jgi:hypothetical protein
VALSPQPERLTAEEWADRLVVKHADMFDSPRAGEGYLLAVSDLRALGES